MATSPVAAQSHYYHIEGDTIRGRCPIYHYEWFWDDGPAGTENNDSAMTSYDQALCYMRHTTDTALRIVGIAFCFDIGNINECGTDQYLRLFDATPGGPVELASIRWTDDYNKGHAKRYMQLPEIGSFNNHCGNLQRWYRIRPVLEYYFDSAITVTDSFYVGSSHYVAYYVPMPDTTGLNWFQRRVIEDSIFGIQDQFRSTHSYRYYQMTPYVAQPVACQGGIPEMHYINHQDWNYVAFRNAPLEHDTAFTHWTYNEMLLTFPIIEVDTVGLPYDTAFFVRRYGEQPIDTTQLSWQAPDRAMSAGPAFTVVPNPARGSVTLTLEGEAALPATVTVLDLQGRELRRETLRSSTHTLNLQGIPPATYILRLDTPQGSSSRKLTVE